MNPQYNLLSSGLQNILSNSGYSYYKITQRLFCWVRVKELDEQHSMVTVPYKWFTKNPFRSTYFACLSMAAEMSTGSLAMAQCFKRKPAVSMLVVKAESVLI